ncbi:hypothetical protein [Alterisphingorhabdus coralli]|uniref:Uncharacterized protein n=1 Tax=Alterisphingorhabdus coralli TaxID=3071408 RepID=A0AA97I329_9SPHN|nr:hypothetical protein [Parasphingorhabdus sp. SCSIO 66989]WOE76340.1 hypothetical protein RB602_06405 [Parasphingorhabdus sp. SCSIO 66989]
MTDNRDLVVLPGWSAFFVAMQVKHRLFFRWFHTPVDDWVCIAWTYTNDLTKPLKEIVLATTKALMRFDALERAITASGVDVSPGCWALFFQFRKAAGETGETGDLL